MKMKGIISGLLFVLFTTFGMAQAIKNVEHSFKASSATTLSIENAFGDIKIKPSTGSKIEVLVTITVEAKNGNKTQEYIDKISIEATEVGNTVSLKTKDERRGSTNVKKFSIDYDVLIPDGTNLKIENSFGDVHIEKAEGVVDITVKHGDCFIAETVGDSNKIHVEFGDLRINNAGDLALKIRHGDVDLGIPGALDLDIQFGDCSIDLLHSDAEVDIQHGDLDIEDVSAKLNHLDIKAQFSDIDISGISKGEIVAELEGDFTDFKLSGSWVIEIHTKDYNSEKLKISTRENVTSGKLLKITANHSNVDLE